MCLIDWLQYILLTFILVWIVLALSSMSLSRTVDQFSSAAVFSEEDVGDEAVTMFVDVGVVEDPVFRAAFGANFKGEGMG